MDNYSQVTDYDLEDVRPILLRGKDATPLDAKCTRCNHNFIKHSDPNQDWKYPTPCWVGECDCKQFIPPDSLAAIQLQVEQLHANEIDSGNNKE